MEHKLSVKMIILMFFIIPVMSSFILGYEMKADVAMSIPTVVMDSDDSSFTRMFLDYVDDSVYFDIEEYADSYDEVEDNNLQGKGVPRDNNTGEFLFGCARGQGACDPDGLRRLYAPRYRIVKDEHDGDTFDG